MSSRHWFAIAAIGRDRPGIVADLSECVYACGCNLEDASMTTLGNEFATLMLVSGTGEDVARELGDACKRLEWERNLTVFVRPLDAPPAEAGDATKSTHVVTAQGVDKAGIVAGFSRALAERGIAIVDLRGGVVPVPGAGTPVYTMSARINVTDAVDTGELEEALGAVGDKLDVDVSLAASE